ncbi:MAG: binding-protein-dependent transport system inner rane component [Chloroflexi bacterium]|nr:binding-protein-dependent transport system inner rane component [Chloroflexota bacterium]
MEMRTKPTAMPRGRSARLRWPLPPGALARHAVLIFFCLVAIVPVVWVFSMSLKPVTEAYLVPIRFFPKHFTFDAYSYAFTNIPELPHYFLNSVIVTTGGLVGVLVISSLAGYSLVCLTFPGQRVVVAALAASLFFPTQITSVIGIYQVNANLNLLDNLIGLILPYIAINLVVSTFVMTGVFRTIPKELLEAARADGCSPLRTFWQIALPLCANGLIVVGMLNFIAMWGEFLLAYTLTSTSAARTLTVGMAEATAGTGVWEWPRIAAVFIMMIVPPFVLFIGLQRWFMKGLMEGALRQ